MDLGLEFHLSAGGSDVMIFPISPVVKLASAVVSTFLDQPPHILALLATFLLEMQQEHA
jgi:hypothetical protein